MIICLLTCDGIICNEMLGNNELYGKFHWSSTNKKTWKNNYGKQKSSHMQIQLKGQNVDISIIHLKFTRVLTITTTVSQNVESSYRRLRFY